MNEYNFTNDLTNDMTSFDVNAMFDLFEQQNARSAVFSTATLGRYTSQPYQQVMPSQSAILQPGMTNLEFQNPLNQPSPYIAATHHQQSDSSTTTSKPNRRGGQARPAPYTVPIKHSLDSNHLDELSGFGELSGSLTESPFMGSTTATDNNTNEYNPAFEDTHSDNNANQDIQKLNEGVPVRGRRVGHREAEKQRRESLKVGFERLKELLPHTIVGTDKVWSQAKLLESGLDYIEQLKEELAKKERENRKLKEAVRRIVAAHNESLAE
ncbi:hypothetical protein BDR26DRAFT_862084 [Obelidium mucronatum]|nr:hypothetical protein BDR26DRAFT_862084 [Obelidium mucronatum]